VQITAGATPGPENKVVIDGVDITNRVRSIRFEAGADRNSVTTLVVEYLCIEGVEVDGIAYVRHNCPLAEEDKSAA
jgi:hypothetical protein